MSTNQSEIQAVLTRAAEQEARRQAAIARGDHQASRHAEDELDQLRTRHADLTARDCVASE